MEHQLIPSLLAADFYQLSEEVQAIEKAGVRHLHLDIMDGHFVPNLSFGPGLIAKLRPHTDLFFDTHLMVEEPDRLLSAFQEAGSDLITVHAEACTHLHRTLQKIHELGLQAGVSLNPASPLSLLDYVMDEVDLILLMSVNPGFGGQAFIPSTWTKLQAVRKKIDQSGRPILLEVDGGVHQENIRQLADVGVNWLVAGSAVFRPGQTYEGARALLEALEGNRA